MENKTIIILAGILVVVLGIFAFSFFGSDTSSGVAIANQYTGGGCGV